MKPQTGYVMKIEVRCETTDELLAHLSVIRKRIKKECKVFKDGEIPDGIDVQFDDNNCYGIHEVTIEPDYEV